MSKTTKRQIKYLVAVLITIALAGLLLDNYAVILVLYAWVGWLITQLN